MRNTMTGKTPVFWLRVARTAALAAILGWLCMLPFATWAQVFPLPGKLLVAIDSPPSGATVGGTTTVSARVTIAGSLTVGGVQFELDGANLGAEDTTAPYSVSWNSTLAINGSHVLTAVARDLLGVRWRSDPITVTVFNEMTPPNVVITSPAPGSRVSRNIQVTADASDNFAVASVQFEVDGDALGAADATAPYEVSWDTTTVPDGEHTLTAVATDSSGNATRSSPLSVTVSNEGGPPPSGGFAAGDILLSLENTTGSVQWRAADGTLKGTLDSVSDGPSLGVRFDAAGNLLVTHWVGTTTPGNTVGRLDPDAQLVGSFGETCPTAPLAPSCFFANPSSIDVDTPGNVYVGQATDSKDILKFDPAGNLLASFDVAVEAWGSDFIALAPDDCTIFYTSRAANVLRFDVCAGMQLPIFNAAPLPGSAALTVRPLPDGGLLVADYELIVRLDAAGNQVQIFDAEGKDLWAGLDLVGDGTFWATSFDTGDVVRFDLATATVLDSFSTGTGPSTVVSVAIRPWDVEPSAPDPQTTLPAPTTAPAMDVTVGEPVRSRAPGRP